MMYQKQLGKVFHHPNYATGIALWVAPLNGALEQYRAMTFDQTTPGASVDINIPIDDTIIFSIDLVNRGTQSIDVISGVYTFTLVAGNTLRVTWDGAKFSEAKAGASTDAVLVDGSVVSTLALPAATGSGATRFYVNKDVSGPVTLSVPAGESLNGVLNGTFTFTNYGVGAQFIATDYGTGKWAIAVEGASTQTSLHHVGLSRATAGNIPSAASIVSISAAALSKTDPFGLVVNDSIVVKQNGKYQIVFSASFAGTTGGAGFEVTKNGSAVANSHTLSGSFTDASATLTWQGDLVVGDVIRIKTTNAIATVNIYNPSLSFQQLPTATAVLAGMVTPTPLHYGHVGWSSASAPAVKFTATGVSGTPLVASANTARFPFASANFMNGDGLTVDTVNNQFIVTQNGRYLITVNANIEVSAAGGGVQLVRNGTTVIGTGHYWNGVAAGNAPGTNATWEGDLVVGDTIDGRAWGPSDRIVYAANLTMTQLPTSTVVNPGSVTPTPLVHATGTILTGSPIIPDTVTEAAPIFVGFNNLTLLSGTATLNGATGIVTLPAGTYRVDGSIGNAQSGRMGFRWYVNNVPVGAVGNVIAPSDSAGQAPPTGHAVHEFTLTAPGTLGLGVISASATAAIGGRSDYPTARPWFIIQQLPTATIVANQNLVPVETLTHYRAQLTNNAPSVEYLTAPGVRLAPLFNANGISEGTISGDGNDQIIDLAGRYRFDWLLIADSGQINDDGEVHVVVNGVSVKSVAYNMNQASGVNQTTGTLSVDLNTGDYVSLRYAGSPTSDSIIWEKGSYVQIHQIATRSVLDPGSVPVIDDPTFSTALPTNVPSSSSVVAYVESQTGSRAAKGLFLWSEGGLATSEVVVDASDISFYYSATAPGGQIVAHNRTGAAITLNWFGFVAGAGSLNQKSGNGVLPANGNLSIGPTALAVNQAHVMYINGSDGQILRVTAISGPAASGAAGRFTLTVESLS